MTDDAQLFDPQGRRLYLTGEERTAFLVAAGRAPRQVRTFCGLLHFTGCQLSEALAVTPRRVDLAGQAVVFETLKKRRTGVYRAVPVPESYLDTLDMVHGLRERLTRSEGPFLDTPLWPWSRTTGYRRVIEVMAAAGIEDGPHRCPKGLRHGYGVAAISAAVPLNMLRKWMGHAQIETTAIYANALGAEQRSIAARMWE